MTRNELSDRIDYAKRDLKWLQEIKTNCTTCDDYQQGVCMRYQASPPPEFVEQGCNAWNYDDVPF